MPLDLSKYEVDGQQKTQEQESPGFWDITKRSLYNSVSSLLGLPVDAATGVINFLNSSQMQQAAKDPYGFNYDTSEQVPPGPMIRNPVGGGESIKAGVKAGIGVDANLPENATVGERALYNISGPTILAGLTGDPRAIAGAIGGGLATTVFPDSPVATLLGDVLSSRLDQLARTGKNLLTKQKSAKPSMDSNDQIPLTPGQKSGDPYELQKEVDLRSRPQSYPVTRQFDRDQESAIKRTLGNIQENISKTAGSPQQVASKLKETYTHIDDSLVTRLKNQADQDFNAAKAQFGDQPIIPTTNLVKKVDDLIGELGVNLGENRTLNPLVNKLQEIRNELIIPGKSSQTNPIGVLNTQGQMINRTTPGTSASLHRLSVPQVQARLSELTDMLKGRGVYAGFGGGQTKHAASELLGALKEDLNSVPQAASSLNKARENYAANVEKIKTFRSTTLGKYFNVDDFVAQDPTRIWKKFKGLTETEKPIAMATLQSQAPDMLPKLQRAWLEEKLAKADIPDASSGAVSTNYRTLLKETDPNSPEFGMIFSDPKAKRDILSARNDLSKILQSAPSKLDPTSAKDALESGVAILANPKGTSAGFLKGFIDKTISAVAGLGAKDKATLLFDTSGVRLLKAINEPSTMKPIDFVRAYVTYMQGKEQEKAQKEDKFDMGKYQVE